MADEEVKGLKIWCTEDGSDCLLSYNPLEAEGYVISAERVLAEAFNLGFTAEELISKDKLSRALKEAFEKKVPIKKFSLCKLQDGFCKVEISPDKLSASLTLKKARGGGQPLTLNAIAEAVKSSGVKEFSKEELRNEVLSFFNNPQRHSLLNYEFARGIMPSLGEDGMLSFEVPFLTTTFKKQYFELLEKTNKDLKAFPSLSKFPLQKVLELALLKKDQKIANLIPARKGKDGKDVFGNALPSNKGKEIEVKYFENIKQFGQYLISEADGILEFGRFGLTYYLRVRPHRDAVCSLEISEDKMQVFLNIVPHQGSGQPISETQIAALLHENKILYGIKTKVIQLCLSQAQNGETVETELIAEGIPPLNPEPARLNIKIKKEEKPKVKIKDNGRADYKAMANISLVKKGELIAEIIPARTKGQNGRNVLGEIIPCRAQAQTSLPNFYNLRKETGEDGIIRLYAECDGEYFYEKNSCGVRKLHIIKGDVGLETGNIRFPGHIFIEGSVKSGFTVFAEGNIIVQNTVEEALLSAGGSIEVGQGIKGRGKAVLRAKGEIKCLFAEQATFLAVGDITIERSALHCTIKTNGILRVGKTKGSLLGGFTRARKGITVVKLGSISETRTDVSFGQDYLLLDKIEQIEKEIEKINTRLNEIDSAMKKLSLANNKQLQKLREEKVELIKMKESMGRNLISLRDKFDEYQPSEVLVLERVFPGVVIESHGRKLTIKEEKTALSFSFNPNNGKIDETSIRFHSSKRTIPIKGKR